MSRTWGIFSIMTGSSVSKAAAMQGSAAFLAPLMRTVPSRGLPPRMTSLSMLESAPIILPRVQVRRGLWFIVAAERGDRSGDSVDPKGTVAADCGRLWSLIAQQVAFVFDIATAYRATPR